MGLKRAWTRICEWWPLTRKSTMQAAIDAAHEKFKKMIAEHSSELASMRKRHAVELEERGKLVGEILERLSDIQWDRVRGEKYRVMLDFDPRTFGYGGRPIEELEYLADYFGRYVSHEIRNSKFIQKANDTERQRRYGRQPRDP